MLNLKIKKLLILLIILVCLSSCTKSYNSNKEEDYERYISEVVDAQLYMPNLEDLGVYESIFVSSRIRNDLFFDTTDTIALIVQYDESNYDIATNNLENKYKYISHELENYKDFEASIKNFNFRVDLNSLYEMINYPSNEVVLYPKCSLIVGLNEIEHKIAYLYYWDVEVNCMEDLDKFIEEKFILE